MLKISLIDKYVSKIYLKVLFYSTISFLILNIIIDLFDRIKMFLDNHAKISQYFLFYLTKVPYFLGFLLPIVTIFATVFTLHKLIKNNEIIIMFNAGRSFFSISRALIVLSLGITFFSFILNEFITPYANREMSLVRAKIKKENWKYRKNKSNFSYKGKNGVIYNIEFYDDVKKTIYNTLIEKFDENNELIFRENIAFARYVKGYGWLANKVYIKLFDKNGKEYVLNIKQPLKRCFLLFKETPEDFATPIRSVEELNFWELRKFIKEKREAGIDVNEYEVQYYMKFSFPFLSVIVALLGLGIILRKPSMNLATIIGFSLGISFLFWGFFAIFRSLGIAGRLSPVLAAFTPPIVMFLISIYLIFFRKNKTFR